MCAHVIFGQKPHVRTCAGLFSHVHCTCDMCSAHGGSHVQCTCNMSECSCGHMWEKRLHTWHMSHVHTYARMCSAHEALHMRAHAHVQCTCEKRGRHMRADEVCGQKSHVHTCAGPHVHCTCVHMCAHATCAAKNRAHVACAGPKIVHMWHVHCTCGMCTAHVENDGYLAGQSNIRELNSYGIGPHQNGNMPSSCYHFVIVFDHLMC
jgi:hypothetical protein